VEGERQRKAAHPPKRRQAGQGRPSYANISRGGGVNILIPSGSGLSSWAIETGARRDCPRCGGGGEASSAENRGK
jgi:hypothetical protein